MTTKKVRFIAPDRSQPTLEVFDPEDWLDQDHAARAVWAFVITLDLSAFYDRIEAVEGGAGRPASDPRVLLALWLLATLDGIGSARALERMAHHHLTYRWLAGGVPVNYHTLSDFRRTNTGLLDDLMCQSLAALLAEGLVELDDVLVDGTKVKAAAGRGSYRTRDGLDDYEKRVRQQISALHEELDADPEAASKRRQAARARADRDRMARIEKARRMLDKADQEREERRRKSPKEVDQAKPPQASSTDAQARKMRFASGAIAPGYNIQVATTLNDIIVSILATDRRSDAGLLPVVVSDIETHTGRSPARVIADTTYAVASDIIDLARRSVPITVYAPPPPDKAGTRPQNVRRREQRRDKEPDELKAWRARMASEHGQAIYKQRKRIETINANLHNRNIGQLRVIGQSAVQAVAVLHAIAHNLITARRLRNTA